MDETNNAMQVAQASKEVFDRCLNKVGILTLYAALGLGLTRYGTFFGYGIYLAIKDTIRKKRRNSDIEKLLERRN